MKKLPLILALDVNNVDKIFPLIEQTKDYVSVYKIGPRLFLQEGPSLIESIKKQAPQAQIFLDFKFYDIPSSTQEAVQSAFDIGADFVTVHASLGLHTLKKLYQLECQANKERFFKVLCVTVLSSVEFSKDIENQVLTLADLVYASGLRSLVCSAWEAKSLKQKYADLFLVTPGIRLTGDTSNDQKRVMSARQALQEGSNALVIGRSLIDKKNPEQILKKLAESLTHYDVCL